jgi:hypothetical protein
MASRRFADLSLILLFLGMICLPAGLHLSGWHLPAAMIEPRHLADMPRLKLKGAALHQFPAQFEAYFNDHFGLRSTLLRWRTLADVDWLRVSPAPKIILGQKGWLFYTEKMPGLDYQSRRPFTEKQLAHWQQILEARRDWLASRHIRYLFVIAPDKQAIYPEDLPRSLRAEQSRDTRLDQLMRHLHAHCNVTVVDLREPLRQAKTREPVYSATDSHWNGRGAYAAYRRLVERLRPWFPDLQPWPRSDFEEVEFPQFSDCAQMLGLTDRLGDVSLDLMPRQLRQARLADKSVRLPLSPVEPLFAMEQANSRLPRAIMFRDSFGAHLVPFLSEHFQRIVYAWQDVPSFETELIEREHPDVIIQEVVERKLAYPDLADARMLPPPFDTEAEAALCRTGPDWLRWLSRDK